MRIGFGAPCVNDASSCILTCRRSASPRATGLGTGTEGATGAPPSPVRPWSSSIEPRGRDITANRTSTPRRWIPQNQLRSSCFCYSKRRSKTNTLIHLMASSSTFPPVNIKINFCRLLAPVTMQLYFCSRRGNRSRMFIRRCV